MNRQRLNITNVVATAVLVTILLCVGSFWARWLCSVERVGSLPESAREVTIYPSRQVTTDGGGDPNLLAPPRVVADTRLGGPHSTCLGWLHYVQTRTPGTPAGPRIVDQLFRWGRGLDDRWAYFDASLGLFVSSGTERIRQADGTTRAKRLTYYAGPEGVSTTPDKRLGRFRSPVAETLLIQPEIVYDSAFRRFFAISWREDELDVRKGPELPGDALYRPVQIRGLQKNLVRVHIPAPDKVIDGDRSPESAFWSISSGWYPDRALVLDASGRIDWLDTKTLEMCGPAGYLPKPTTLFGLRRSCARPEDVAAYQVNCLDRHNREGVAVATLSREGLALQLDYFDESGTRIATGETKAPWYKETAGEEIVVERIASEKAAYDHRAGLTMAKFLLESLHPPVLMLASYRMGPHLEATTGYRSMFLLPDSFVAMVARAGGDVTSWERFLWALAYMLPGLFFFGILALRIARDAARVGLVRNSRRLWIGGTLLLGLPIYVTYRLTRPKVTLVTCVNCGLGRRPDREKCHHCGSVWAVPELVPPMWRVLGEPEQAEAALPSPVDQPNQSSL